MYESGYSYAFFFLHKIFLVVEFHVYMFKGLGVLLRLRFWLDGRWDRWMQGIFPTGDKKNK